MNGPSSIDELPGDGRTRVAEGSGHDSAATHLCRMISEWQFPVHPVTRVCLSGLDAGGIHCHDRVGKKTSLARPG
jgi:hypothetical protein